jgi:DnaK suppressor protein
MATPAKSSKKPASQEASQPEKTPVAEPVKKAAKAKVEAAPKSVKKKADVVPTAKAPAKKLAAQKEAAGESKVAVSKKPEAAEHAEAAKKSAAALPKQEAVPAKDPAPAVGAGKKVSSDSHAVSAPVVVKPAPAPVKAPVSAEKAVVAPRVFAPKAPVIDLTATPVSNPLPNGGHSAAFVEKQGQRLLDLRDELVDAMSGISRDTIRNAPEGSEASGSGMHQGDAGSDAYDRDFALSVLAKEQDALYEIEEALKRIRRNTYGVCELSGKKIPHTRLEAIPFARLTVECQGQWEKEYGNRRFRPSNQVGFSGGQYDEDDDSETVSLDEDED